MERSAWKSGRPANLRTIIVEQDITYYLTPPVFGNEFAKARARDKKPAGFRKTGLTEFDNNLRRDFFLAQRQLGRPMPM